ncbi:uncharacterized protein PRCAT00002704001 [Priceomyces carsonii]|nr:unnamed protein product [Priceomyces carsonii]
MRFLWIEHRTFRLTVTGVELQSDALPTELKPQYKPTAGVEPAIF